MEMRLGLLGRTEQVSHFIFLIITYQPNYSTIYILVSVQVALEMSRNAQASGERGNRTPAVGSTPGGKTSILLKKNES